MKQLEIMAKIANRELKSHKTDFTIYDTISYNRMYENTEFIWVVRSTGTYQIGIPSTIEAKTTEQKQKNESARKFSNAVIDSYGGKSASYFHIKKGKFIKRISMEKAKKLVNEF